MITATAVEGHTNRISAIKGKLLWAMYTQEALHSQPKMISIAAIECY